MALWGSAFASSKLSVEAVPHEVAAALRFGIGAVILLVVHTLTRAERLRPRAVGLAAGLGMFGIFGYNLCFFLALSHAPSADGSVIVPVTAPVITVAVSALLGRRKLTARAALGLTVAVAGAVVFFVGIPEGGSTRLAGDLVFLCAAACWACYTMLGAPVLAKLPAFGVTTWATTAGGAALALLAIPRFGEVTWSALGAGFWVNAGYLAVLPTALAYVLYYRVVRDAGPTTAASAMFLVPVFGLTCSWLLLGESITPWQGAGALLMLAGAWLATIVRTRRPQPTPPGLSVDRASARKSATC
jgi:drug/metabolite transporter (DMT)-like permease